MKAKVILLIFALLAAVNATSLRMRAVQDEGADQTITVEGTGNEEPSTTITVEEEGDSTINVVEEETEITEEPDTTLSVTEEDSTINEIGGGEPEIAIEPEVAVHEEPYVAIDIMPEPDVEPIVDEEPTEEDSTINEIGGGEPEIAIEPEVAVHEEPYVAIDIMPEPDVEPIVDEEPTVIDGNEGGYEGGNEGGNEGGLAGGIRDLDVSEYYTNPTVKACLDLGVKDLLDAAEKDHLIFPNEQTIVGIVKINRIQAQVVAGTKYTFDVITTDGNYGHTFINFSVLDQPWTNTRKTLNGCLKIGRMVKA